jgi:hypothetical protein
LPLVLPETPAVVFNRSASNPSVPASRRVWLLLFAAVAGGCTIDRTASTVNAFSGDLGLSSAWDLERSSAWRLPEGVSLLVVADSTCREPDCEAAAVFGATTTLNLLLRDVLLEQLAGPFPRSTGHPEALPFDPAMDLARRADVDFLVHVQADGMTASTATQRGGGRLRLLLADARTGRVVDRALVSAQLDRFGRSRDLRALMTEPVKAYTAGLAGR